VAEGGLDVRLGGLGGHGDLLHHTRDLLQGLFVVSLRILGLLHPEADFPLQSLANVAQELELVGGVILQGAVEADAHLAGEAEHLDLLLV